MNFKLNKNLHDLVLEQKKQRLDRNKLNDYAYSYLNKELPRGYYYDN